MKYAVPVFLVLIVISVTTVATLTVNDPNNASGTNIPPPAITPSAAPRTNLPFVNPANQETPQVTHAPLRNFGEVVVPMRPNSLKFPQPTPTRTQETSPVPSPSVSTPRPTQSTVIPTRVPTTAPVTTQITVSSTPPQTTATPAQIPTTTPVTTQTTVPSTQPQTTATPTQIPTTTPVATQTTVPSNASQTVPPTTTSTPTPTPTLLPTQPNSPTNDYYPSGGVYSPTYYYPPGYSYPISSYYPGNTLTVTSDPSDAVVLLDGYNSESTPWVYTNVLPGYHTIEIDYPGYEAYITDVDIPDGTNPEIDATLVPLQTYGSMFIDSTPEGADVYVDGNYEGISPVTVAGLTEGSHQLELHLAGYEVLTDTENVYNGQSTVVNLPLEQYSSSSEYGSIDVTSDEPGALVYLDGTYKGATSAGTIFNLISIIPGSHTLLLHDPGFPDFVQTVQVNAGQVSSVNVAFNQNSPGPTPQETLSASVPAATGTSSEGSIVASSSPAGGQVYIDNQYRGVAPVTVYNVAPGNHIVNMQLSGYEDWSGSVDVAAGQVSPVAATLTPGTSAEASPTPVSLMPGIACIALGACAVLVARRRRR